MAEATVTVAWSERLVYGRDGDWHPVGNVLVARGRESCTHDVGRLREGTFALAGELLSARERRRVRQVDEVITTARIPNGLERHVVREYLVLGLVG